MQWMHSVMLLSYSENKNNTVWLLCLLNPNVLINHVQQTARHMTLSYPVTQPRQTCQYF